MSQPGSRFSRPALSDRSSISNVPIQSSSLPTTTFAPPAIVRIHSAVPRAAVKAAAGAAATAVGGGGGGINGGASTACGGKENNSAIVASQPAVTDQSPPVKPSVEVVVAASRSPQRPPSPMRLSFARPSERVLTIHTISDRESLARLSVEPTAVSAPAPSFRYSLRSSYRPYQWTAPGAGRQSTDGQRPLAEAGVAEPSPVESSTSPPSRGSRGVASSELSSPPAAGRPPSPAVRTPDCGGSLHRRQRSARKSERHATAAEPLRAPTQTALSTTASPSRSSPFSQQTAAHISRTPLLSSSSSSPHPLLPSSSSSTLPYYRTPASTAGSPLRPMRPWPTRLRAEEVNEESDGQRAPAALSDFAVAPSFSPSSSSASSLQLSLGLTAAVDSDPSFRAFVASNAYAAYESEVVNNVDLIRRSNALNEDTADYVLILQPDHVTYSAAHNDATWHCMGRTTASSS